MKEFLESTLGKVLLLVLVITIWGINALQFSSLSGPEIVRPSLSADENSAAVTELVPTNYRYNPGVLDPFRQSKDEPPPKPSTASPINSKELVYDQSEIALSGVIGKTAILVLSSGERFLAVEGDTVAEFIVLRVTMDSVRVVRDNQEFILTTN